MTRKPTHLALGTALCAFLTLPAAAQAPATPAGAAAPAKTTAPAKPAAQPSFASPEEAAETLVAGVRAEDKKGVTKLMGPGADAWLFTGDEVSDREEWKRFLASYDAKHVITKEGDAKATLAIGDDWPFPAPLVKRGDRWVFDGGAGRIEVTNRRVGRNELDTIQTLLAVVDAQLEYASRDADKNGYNDYARRFLSTEGKKDGLFWPTQEGEPESPLGPLVGLATKEGYGKNPGKPGGPYHGYYFRMLTAQGKDAAGGAYDYLVKDKLLGGFAVVAYPTTYGVSGVMTFLVNHDGKVYESDLGPGTAAAAEAMKGFNPGKGWKLSTP